MDEKKRGTRRRRQRRTRPGPETLVQRGLQFEIQVQIGIEIRIKVEIGVQDPGGSRNQKEAGAEEDPTKKGGSNQ
ncbi:hypothetical protein V5799_031746, partial [Amblyomma americanum]